MNAEQILAGIRDPHIAMTKEQISSAWDALKVRNSALSAMAATNFAVGDKVEFVGKSGARLEGVVKKINQKSINVEVMQEKLFGPGAKTMRPVTWRVAAPLLKKV